jgi:tetratricopeptide (TPR) repeat protein
LALAETAEPGSTGADQAARLERLEAERDNLRAALAWNMEQGRTEASLRLATALSMFWWLRGPLSEGASWLARALERGSDAPAELRARALDAASGLAYQQGDFGRVIALEEEMLALARGFDDTALVARGLAQLAVAVQAQDDHARAVALYEELLALARESGDAQGEATAYLGLGWSLHLQGDHARAAMRLAEALDGFRMLGDQNRVVMALLLDAVAARDTGARERAASRFREAVALLAEIGDTVHLVGVVASLATALAAWGWPDSAVRLFGAAEAMSEAVDAPFPTWFPAERTRCEEAIAAARAALGEEVFGDEWKAGRALPMEAAVDEALALASNMETDGGFHA